ncbi:hypothetical protein GCM10009788_25220 [Nocardioides humi]|uniref:N-acetyltransferase domain-containing protein n=1 Tax=Nocardioides humi TaxID=449461 RepID=A0ABN2AK76_9ACTN
MGRRVVVRRLLRGETGPTGGPAFTDLLGTCLSWRDGACVVQPETGAAVTIPIADIVSGKPVPPRPSVRQRVTVRDAELHTAALEGIETTPLGEWQLRYEPAPSGRVRNRFNSCLGVGDPGMPVADAAHAVRSFYSARGRSPRIQVELGSANEEALRALGWQPVPGRDSHFLLASLSRARRSLEPADGSPSLEVDGPRVRAVLDGVAEGRAVLDGVAEGRAGLDGDWLGIHDLQVAPEHRRRGRARAVLAALLEWGAERGALTVWLHVETGNEPALALYERLGFTRHHTCRYYSTNPLSTSQS